MESDRRRIWFGGLAIVAGVLLLLQYLEIFGGFTDMIWALSFIAGGLGLLGYYIAKRGHWWPLIPGIILLTLGVIVGAEAFAGGLGEWAGPVVLGGIGLSFLAVYLVERSAWWMLIPAGTLLSLSALTTVEIVGVGFEPAALLFIGLGLTFAILSALRIGDRHQIWPLFPAAALLVMGFLMLIGREEWLNLIWPLALIGGGVYVLLRGTNRGGPTLPHPR